MTKDRASTNQPTSRISGDELARLAELTMPDPRTDEHLDAEALSEWEGSGVAAGTPPRDGTPVVSRTSTRHDPLTTAVLAEIARSSEDRAPSRPTPSPHVRPKR